MVSSGPDVNPSDVWLVVPGDRTTSEPAPPLLIAPDKLNASKSMPSTKCICSPAASVFYA